VTGDTYTSFGSHPTGWPTTQDKVYRAGETIPLGKVLSEFNPETKKWEPVAVCR
jgi:hypothetical protein